MTEELKPVEVKEEQPAPEVVELSPIEQKAVDLGWRPKEEFEGDEDDFVEAKEFVQRQKYFDKIDSQNKELKAVRKALESFKKHYGQVEITAYNRALADLKAQRKEAMSAGDGDAFERVDEQIKQVEQQAAVAKATHEAPIVIEDNAVTIEFTNWKNRNPWYDNKKYMKTFADELGVKLYQDGNTPEEVFRKVEQEVRKKFPDEFTNARKSSAPSVEEGRPNGKSTTKSLEDSMSATERSIMRTLVDGKHMTKEQYLKDFAAIKGIRN